MTREQVLYLMAFSLRLSGLQPVSQRSEVSDPAAPRAASHSAGPGAEEPVAMHHGGCVHEAHQQRGELWRASFHYSVWAGRPAHSWLIDSLALK